MKFKKKKNSEIPKINTASLPDIIFMLLFFFMVTTVMRSREIPPNLELPTTVQPDKIKSKDEIKIWVSGDEINPSFIINNTKINTESMEQYLGNITAALTEYEKSKLRVLLFIDEGVKMKQIYLLKKALRVNKLYKIVYMSK